MAKLSAHGTELLRMERSHGIDTGRVRQTYALMSDGVLLGKTDWFKLDKFDFGTGWKRTSLLGVTAQPAEIVREKLVKLGFTEVR